MIKKATNIKSRQLGHGFATYGKVDGVWFSINTDGLGNVMDFRWKATAKEVAVLEK